MKTDETGDERRARPDLDRLERAFTDAGRAAATLLTAVGEALIATIELLVADAVRAQTRAPEYQLRPSDPSPLLLAAMAAHRRDTSFRSTVGRSAR